MSEPVLTHPAPTRRPALAEGTLDRDTFAALFRRHPAGVAVITVVDGVRPVGFTATSVISVSASPAVLAFSVNDSSSSWPALERSGTVTVNLLAEHQRQVSTVFATPGVDRFAQVDWHRLPTGEAVLYGTAGWISGRILERVPAGGSHVVLVAADRAEISNEPPLVYRNRTYHQLIEYEI